MHLHCYVPLLHRAIVRRWASRNSRAYNKIATNAKLLSPYCKWSFHVYLWFFFSAGPTKNKLFKLREIDWGKSFQIELHSRTFDFAMECSAWGPICMCACVQMWGFVCIFFLDRRRNIKVKRQWWLQIEMLLRKWSEKGRERQNSAYTNTCGTPCHCTTPLAFNKNWRVHIHFLLKTGLYTF